jgi:ribosomal RNA-processing protein 7
VLCKTLEVSAPRGILSQRGKVSLTNQLSEQFSSLSAQFSTVVNTTAHGHNIQHSSMAPNPGESLVDSDKNSLSSFTILTLSLPSSPAFPASAKHYLYIRADSPKHPTDNTPRSIFVANIPVDASESSIRTLFKQINGARVAEVVFEHNVKDSGPTVQGDTWGIDTAGKKKRKRQEIEAASLEDDYALPSTWALKLKKSGSSATVVFVDRSTAESVLKEARRMAKKGEKLHWKTEEPLGEESVYPLLKIEYPLTSTGYIQHHKLTYPPKSVLQQSVNAYLAQYTRMEDARTKQLKQLRSEPDDDGFVTVTSGGRNAPAKLFSAQAAAERLTERAKKKSIGNNFYRFQAREEAKRKERQLREKFEEDAQKVKEMRARRGRIKPE